MISGDLPYMSVGAYERVFSLTMNDSGRAHQFYVREYVAASITVYVISCEEGNSLDNNCMRIQRASTESDSLGTQSMRNAIE